MTTSFKFHLHGKTAIFIDWANVHGWEEKLKWEISPKKLFKYLASYPQIKSVNFYFGVEKGNEKSEKFQKEIKKIGYRSISKEVKWVPINIKKYLSKHLSRKELRKIPDVILRRKCDFDCELAIDVLEGIEIYQSFIFFSADGDYASLVDKLIQYKKQVIVVALRNLMGREYFQLIEKNKKECGNQKFFIAEIGKIKKEIKK